MLTQRQNPRLALGKKTSPDSRVQLMLISERGVKVDQADLVDGPCKLRG